MCFVIMFEILDGDFLFYTFIMNFYCYLGVLIFGLDLIMICVLMSR
jgi:hypothetical protein